MKKCRLLIYSLLSVITLPILSCGIDGRKDNQDVMYIGERKFVRDINKDNGEGKLYLTNNGFDFETIENNILVKSKAILEPIQTFFMSESDYFAEVNNIAYNGETEEGKILTSKEYNIKENGYDIFDKEISSKMTYTFCFITPKYNAGIEFKLASCHAFHIYELVNEY